MCVVCGEVDVEGPVVQAGGWVLTTSSTLLKWDCFFIYLFINTHSSVSRCILKDVGVTDHFVIICPGLPRQWA